jgi:hypothetical protein
MLSWMVYRPQTMHGLVNQRSEYPAVTSGIADGRFLPEEVKRRFDSEVRYLSLDLYFYSRICYVARTSESLADLPSCSRQFIMKS